MIRLSRGRNPGPACPLALIPTTGAPPAYPGAVAPLMVTLRDTRGSGLDRVIMPRTVNLISAGRPGRLVFTVAIAARSDPGPASLSRLTVRVRAYAGGGFEWPGRVAALAAAALPHISPDAATPEATRAAPAARPGTRGTAWPLRTIAPRRERTWVTILNTILSRSPVDGIKQEYALAGHLPNSREAFRENRPHSAWEIRLISAVAG